MEQEQYKERVRIEVSTSVKGIHSYSVTVEGRDQTDDEVLARSDALVAKLDAKYPKVEA